MWMIRSPKNIWAGKRSPKMRFAPLCAVMALASPLAALIAATGVATAAGAASLVQLYFRVQARRSQFRRRQTSSRLTTFAEALSSISWAAAAGMALHGTWHAVTPAIFALGILAGAWMMSRRQSRLRTLTASATPLVAP